MRYVSYALMSLEVYTRDVSKDYSCKQTLDSQACLSIALLIDNEIEIWYNFNISNLNTKSPYCSISCSG